MIWLELLHARANRVVEEYISMVLRSACWAAEVLHKMLQFYIPGRKRDDAHGVRLVKNDNLVLAGRQRDLSASMTDRAAWRARRSPFSGQTS
jgi:hypothetical protein